MENLNTSTNGVTPKAKPRSLVCYICGREFGTKSLKIHLKTCAQKWEWEESKKPKKDQRPVPQAPLDLDEVGFLNIEKYAFMLNKLFLVSFYKKKPSNGNKLPFITLRRVKRLIMRDW
jgi:hypothetical protein